MRTRSMLLWTVMLPVSTIAPSAPVASTPPVPAQEVETVEPSLDPGIVTGSYEFVRDLTIVPEAGAEVPSGWTPDAHRTLDDNLPYPWPESYVEQYDHPFNPWTFYINALTVCSYYDSTADPLALDLLDQLVERLLEYTTLTEHGRYVLYHFPWRYRTWQIAPPWTSAFASGTTAAGLTFIAGCSEQPALLTTAAELIDGLANPIDPRDDRRALWVSFVDADGFLWFEEMPLDEVEQPRILNGHMQVLIGLYTYWLATDDPVAHELLAAGLRTIEEYGLEYRVPGDVNRYDLLEPYSPDYGPERAVNQFHTLYEITGDTVFEQLSNLFAEDVFAVTAAAA